MSQVLDTILSDGEFVRTSNKNQAPPAWIRLLSIFKIRFFVPILGIVGIATVLMLLLPAKKNMLEKDVPVPPISAYCAQTKELIADQAHAFDPILGGKSGDNRIPTVPLPNWEDCIVFMENQFTSRRRFSCSLSDYLDEASASAAADRISTNLAEQCLGPQYSISRGKDLDNHSRFRIVGRGTEATIGLRLDKSSFSNTWIVRFDLE